MPKAALLEVLPTGASTTCNLVMTRKLNHKRETYPGISNTQGQCRQRGVHRCLRPCRGHVIFSQPSPEQVSAPCVLVTMVPLLLSV